MSYDIYMDGPICLECGNAPAGPGDLPNPTYNLTEIFDLALTGESFPNSNLSEGEVVVLGKKTDRPRGLRVLTGMSGEQSAPILVLAEARLEDPAWAHRFNSLAPSNGWGTVDGARATINRLKSEAIAYPKHVWRIQ